MANPGLMDVAIAPLKLLERTKGWRRRGLIVLYLFFASTVGVLGYRAVSLWRLPDIGEPFDLAKYGTVTLAEADNALPLYEAADKQMTPYSKELKGLNFKAWDVRDWTKVDPLIRAWVESNGPAMELWLRAVDRPDAMQVQPSKMSHQTILMGSQAIRNLSHVAILEAARREQAGDLAGAWTIYRGLLRSSRHAGRHGAFIQRLTGYAILKQSQSAIRGWAENPAVTPDMLRRAILDIEACRAMTPPNSEMIRVEYFAVRNLLDHPEQWMNASDEGNETRLYWVNQLPFAREVRHFMAREPERSLRVHRLITASLLAQVDRPRSVRPRLISDKYVIFDVDSQTPPSLASISPEELAAWADRSAYGSIVNPFGLILTYADLEPGILGGFQMRMAERGFEIEKGHPPKTYGELVGPFLKTLPEGVEPDFPIGAVP